MQVPFRSDCKGYVGIRNLRKRVKQRSMPVHVGTALMHIESPRKVRSVSPYKSEVPATVDGARLFLRPRECPAGGAQEAQVSNLKGQALQGCTIGFAMTVRRVTSSRSTELASILRLRHQALNHELTPRHQQSERLRNCNNVTQLECLCTARAAG